VSARTWLDHLHRSRELHQLLTQVHALESAILVELRETDRLIHEAELGHDEGAEIGRPTEWPSLETAFKILLERSRNGKIGVRALADRVGVGWRQVERVLASEYAPSQNPRSPSRKSDQ
jgi:hypothetical protein